MHLFMWLVDGASGEVFHFRHQYHEWAKNNSISHRGSLIKTRKEPWRSTAGLVSCVALPVSSLHQTPIDVLFTDIYLISAPKPPI